MLRFDKYDKHLSFDPSFTPEDLEIQIPKLLNRPRSSDNPLTIKVKPRATDPFAPKGKLEFFFLPSGTEGYTSVEVRIKPKAFTIETYLLIFVFLFPVFGLMWAFSNNAWPAIIFTGLMIAFFFLGLLAQKQAAAGLTSIVYKLKRKLNSAALTS